MPEGWLYENTPDNTARFVLGTVGENPLICVGVNPSTATPLKLDRTVTRIARRAAKNNYDSWIMLNLYPQRSKDPDGMHTQYLPELKAQNEKHIAELLRGRSVTLLAAWGELIEKRAYLPEMLDGIAQIAEQGSCGWMSIGSPLKRHHPRHPSRAPYDTSLQSFDMATYLRTL
ncbi:DUF1643 domain-containing protein [Microbacterium sp. BR1]|uniref:DUF1643 domain-containing protein n=1 Tax=Microbacterium sp. BR1 TaxID=1070896 RepID=UPI0012FD060F|nr:DUF1643 domain-containing protein [Microbacterium sp. BR1]